jgi:hypothetical protein
MALSRSTRGNTTLKPPLNRVGHIQRQVRRAFIACRGSPLSTSELARRCYPRLAGINQSWRWAQIRKAASRWAVRIGRSERGTGRPVIWAPKR